MQEVTRLVQELGGMLPNVDLHNHLVYEVSFQYNTQNSITTTTEDAINLIDGECNIIERACYITERNVT